MYEKPLFTGHLKRTRASRILSRRHLRREHNAFEKLCPDLPVRRKSITAKPYHRTTCPGEWRYFSILSRMDGEETIWINEYARTCGEAANRIKAQGHIVLEVRQQKGILQESEVDSFWS